MIFYSIIIVNYKTPQLILDCLQTIFTNKITLPFEVFVVDNFSEDNSESEIRTKFTDVKWIQMDYNSGFSRANNAGILAASGDVVLLLNSDTLNEQNNIEKCVERFRDSDAVACGIQLLNPDLSPQISGNFFITGGLNQLMALPYMGRLLRWLAYTFKVKKTNVLQVKGTLEVDWINGAFLMVKKEAIEKAGMLDEDFFLYFEEIEWCSRLRKIGKLFIYGDLNIVHLQGGSANEAFKSEGKGYYNLYDRKGLQIMVSALLRIRKQYGVAWFIFHLFIYLITIPVFFIGVLISSPF
ncbi:MAG: glycosyltransferase family 2 protein, partial [Chitinophagaceae bacterium]